MPHLRPLDGLRGIAVLAVVLYHFSPDVAPGGFLGVDIFFVLSGFLITSLLVNERERSHAISLLRFWIRRARRLLPALVLVLLAVGLSTLVMSDHAQARRIDVDGLFALGYLANWRFIWSGQSYVEQILRTAPSPVRHTWSLAIEEQFYLVWPLIVVGVSAVVAKISGARNGNVLFRRALLGVCVALGTLSFVRMVTLFSHSGDANRAYYGTDTHAFLLLGGAALGALSAGAPFLKARASRVLLIAAGCASAVALVVIMANLDATSPSLYRGSYALIGVLILVVLVAAAQPGTNPLGWLFSLKPLVGLGLISYGVYLWHWPIVVWVTPERTGLDDGIALFAVRSALTLAVSLVSYVVVEQPIRQGRMLTKWTSAPTFAALGVVSAMVIVLVAPVVCFPRVNPVPRVAPSQSSEASTIDYANGARCDETIDQISPLPDGVAPKVQLFGNSVAVEVRNCLRALVQARGGTFESVVHSGRAPCLLTDELREQVNNPATRPDIAIFSAAIIYTEDLCTNGDNYWLDQVNEALDIWREAGVKVYFVPIVPNIPGTELPPPDEIKWSVPAQRPEMEAMAAADPENVAVLDGGIFIRDAGGVYQWRMPCLPGGEPGCDPADGTIGVRWVDGFHFCTTVEWDGHSCIPENSGGERRVAAAIARQIPELGLGTTTS